MKLLYTFHIIASSAVDVKPTLQQTEGFASNENTNKHLQQQCLYFNGSGRNSRRGINTPGSTE